MPGELVSVGARRSPAVLEKAARALARAVLGILALSAGAACEADPAWSGALPQPDPVYFEQAVYPILMRDCAFSECHGAPHRFLQVFGPGRTRLKGHPSDPDLLVRERSSSYQRAASMLIEPSGTTLERAPLLIKPLAIAAGGSGHRGMDVFGRNLFQSKDDPRYRILLQWAQTQPLIPPADPTLAGAAGTPAPVTTPPVTTGLPP